MEGNTRNLFRNYCLEGSILGLKYFYLYPDRASRCYWAVTMVFSLGMACLVSSFLYRRFSGMPTWITIENQFEPDEDLPYPAITLCSPNQITLSAITDLRKNLVNGNVSTDLTKLIQHFLGFEEVSHELHVDSLEYLQNIIEENRYTVLSILRMLPQRCEDFLKRCIFEEKLYPCEDLFQPILTRHGMCCTFNSIYHFKDKKRNGRKTNFVVYKATSMGLVQGLSVLVDYNPLDALDGTVMNAGATKVLISDWTEFPGVEELNIIHPNAEAFNRITLTYNYCSEEVAALPVSSRNCYFADEFLLPHFKDYHNSDCDLSCFIEQVEKQCRCTPLFVPSEGPHQDCNFTSLICIREVKMQMNKLYDFSQCSCLRNCESRQYDNDVIIGNLDALEHMMYNPFSDLVINESSTIMHFNYPSLTYMKQKQETVMSLVSFGSNLGGVFGLCLGCSFISILEICFYIYIAIKKRLFNVRVA